MLGAKRACQHRRDAQQSDFDGSSTSSSSAGGGARPWAIGGRSQVAHRSVTEIAFACGFSDGTHFARVFATRMGMTPTQWRRQAR